ncbi:MAG: insulinase family protein [Eubacteriales bacterium]|nr:insulinase family protein [Eubacteriales bacterium]
MENIKGYTFIKEEYISEISAVARLYQHDKSGARVMTVECDDENKVFCVSFLTPPEDNCGTPHIIEHSVLCGSDKYPLKEPFVYLLKSSLNTFLNAMTYPDKTIYPVASMNEKDFENLTDVYCDAVFNPLIRTDDFPFRQEGHHYEYYGEDITVNGVVYNEMKGATSSPDDMLFDASQSSLFPGTAYSLNSGGDPDFIPELTYEKYLAFYRKHYHPSNSYIFIYGNTDMSKHLEKLDRDYLSNFDRIVPPEADLISEDFNSQEIFVKQYSVDGEDISNRYWFAVNWAMAPAGDNRDQLALSVLEKILFDTDSSVLKKALSDAGIGEEVQCSFTTEEATSFMTVYVKNAPLEKLELFRNTVNETLEKICREGLDDEVILACVNSSEFSLRESDISSTIKGLIYAIKVMGGWLYGKDPFDQLKYEDLIEYLRDNLSSDFYTGLIKKYMLDNPHKSIVMLEPVSGLYEKKAAEFAEKLSDYKSTLTPEELDRMQKETEELKARQAAPDKPEDIARIPVLEISEISHDCDKDELECYEKGKTRVFVFTGEASDIVYTDINFDISALPAQELPRLKLLRSILGVYATKNYSEYDLGNVQGIYLGGTGSAVSVQQDFADIDLFDRRFTYWSKALFSNADRLFSLAEESLLSTRFDDIERLKVTVKEEISKFENGLINEAESYTLLRMDGSSSAKGAFNSALRGEAYYRYLLSAAARLDRGDAGVLSELKETAEKIVTSAGLDILITCDEKNRDAIVNKAFAFASKLPDKQAGQKVLFVPEKKINEGIAISSAVAYTGLGVNLVKAGSFMPRAFAVTRKFLTTDYLWNNIRVKGGAYGAMMRTDRGGDLMLVSYRDPNVKATYEVYEKIPEILKGLDLTRRETDNFILGTVSDIDMPKTIYSKARLALGYLYAHYPYEERKATREAVLSATLDDIKSSAEQFECLLKEGVKVTFAPAMKLREYENGFDRITSINRNSKDEF